MTSATPAAPLPVAKTQAQSPTIRTAPSLVINLRGPRIASLAQTNPRWMIRIDTTPDSTTFETETIKPNLRYGIGGWAGLGVHCVTDDLVLPMCSPAYLEKPRRYSGDPLRQLDPARLIDRTKIICRWEQWPALDKPTPTSSDYPFRFDRSCMSNLAKQRGDVASHQGRLQEQSRKAIWAS